MSDDPTDPSQAPADSAAPAATPHQRRARDAGAADPAEALPTGDRRQRIRARRRAAAANAPQFSQPVRQILMMLLVLALVGAGAFLAYGRVWAIFQSNLWLNGAILAVFALGVVTCFWQAAQLVGSVSWIERFAARRQTALENGVAPRATGDGDAPPPLLAPLAALLGSAGPAGGLISTTAARSIQDSVATRIDEARDITRYLAQLLIFLGLLGTFYGLATTIPGVVDTIRGLAPRPGESAAQLFGNLMTGLESQLGGMATAFSSSLLGLAGSLVIGLLELFASHGQNRFYRELEEWITGFTRVGLTGPDGDGGSLDHAAIGRFLDQIAAQTVALSDFYARRDELHEQNQIAADERALVMARSVERLAQHVMAEGEAAVERAAHLVGALSRIAEGQQRVVAVTEAAMARLGAAAAAEDGDEAAEARLRLRSIDQALARLAQETTAARADMMVDLRADLAQLTRAVRALGPPNGGGAGGRG